MNKQDPKSRSHIEWTRPYGRDGYTANPVRGCMHDCKWEMPDGSVAECYAKTVAENVAQTAYPNGFAHLSFHPSELAAIRKLKEPAGIFMDSMSDLLGSQVQRQWLDEVLKTMHDCPQHIFFVLTKNPPMLTQLANAFPANAWVGVSAPPTYMFGRMLSKEQQARWYDTALAHLSRVNVPIHWTSIEPLSWDVSEVLEKNIHALQWAVIGAASSGKKYFPPDEAVLKNALHVLDRHYIPVFFKGNLRSLPYAARNWREEFPDATD